MDDTKTKASWARSQIGFVLFWITGFILAWTVLRAVLLAAFGPEGQPISTVALAFASGFHRDVFVALLFALPLLVYMCFMPGSIWSKRWHRTIFWGAGAASVFASLFLLVTEFFFFEEFRSRFNTVAVDYLLFPHEVFVNIWESYHTGLVMAACLLITAGWLWFAAKCFSAMWTNPVPRKIRFASLAVCCLGALACSVGIGFKAPHVSTNRTLNEIANHGTIAFVAAFWTHQLDYAAFYKTMDTDEAYARVRRLLEEPDITFAESGHSIRRKVAGDPDRPKLNVVLILEESFGSEFWGCLGRANSLTPNMDRLAREGLLFTNIYASGNRTVRGMEGVLSSFPPLPGDSIVKRHLTDNVETMARVLHRDGYTNLFFYGGRGLFDSMRSYAVRNGYDRFIEQADFEDPVFSTIWGVSDEDLFARGIQELHELSKSNQPFFATMLTVSNHRPYTFPEGRIPDPQGSRESVVKYTDYALGKFFEQAKQEPFWTNTIFVVVADHGARVYGKQTIPIHSYEIPLLILGPAAVQAPARIASLGCSLDVGPTILGLIGRPYETLFFGHDLLHLADAPGRAFLNHNRDVGMLFNERLVVLGLMQSLEFYTGEPKHAEMALLGGKPSSSDFELARDCMAVYEVADDLYSHKRYALDTAPAQ